MQLRAAWDEDTHISLVTILHLTYAFWQNLNMSQKSLKVMKLTFRMKDKCALAKKNKKKKQDSVQLFAVMMTARWPALSSTTTQQSGQEFKTVGGKSKADWSVKNLSTDLQGVDDDAVVAAAGAEGSLYRKKNKHKRKLLLSLPHNWQNVCWGPRLWNPFFTFGNHKNIHDYTFLYLIRVWLLEYLLLPLCDVINGQFPELYAVHTFKTKNGASSVVRKTLVKWIFHHEAPL